jgi:hypothetical protein
MKTKILKLLKGMNSDSKKESSACEKELCKILTDICNRIESIEHAVGWNVRCYPDRIDEIDIDNTYPGIKKLPEIIWCNYSTFEFETSWLDINLENYFEELKLKVIRTKTNTIEKVEASLNKHKEELEALKNLTYDKLNIDKNDNR